MVHLLPFPMKSLHKFFCFQYTSVRNQLSWWLLVAISLVICPLLCVWLYVVRHFNKAVLHFFIILNIQINKTNHALGGSGVRQRDQHMTPLMCRRDFRVQIGIPDPSNPVSNPITWTEEPVVKVVSENTVRRVDDIPEYAAWYKLQHILWQRSRL